MSMTFMHTRRSKGRAARSLAAGALAALAAGALAASGQALDRSLELVSGGNAVAAAVADGISADGSSVFFDTTEALLPADRDTTADVYEVDGGAPSLVSRGSASIDASFAYATPDGTHVVLETAEALVSEDVDAANDVYVASPGGGGGSPQQAPEPSPGPAAPADQPGTPAAGEDAAAPAVTAALASKRVGVQGAVRIGLGCPAAEASPPCTGTVTLKSAKKLNADRGSAARPRIVTLGRGRFTIDAGERTVVTLRLSKRHRTLLDRLGKLRTRVLIAATDSAGNRTTTTRLVVLKAPAAR